MQQFLKYDAVIIGARAAGAATAMLLARGGARVLIVDRAPEIGDILSTHALMRPAVTLLDDWGLAEPLARAGTAAVRSTTFFYGQEQICIPVKQLGGAEGLLAPRRWLLDRMLVDAAVAAGAELRLGAAFEGCTRDRQGRISDVTLQDATGRRQTVSTGLLIGADGRTSAVAQAVGAATLARSPRGSAAVYAYFKGLPFDGYRWYFEPLSQAGVIPTGDGAHCVFASCRPEHMRTRFGADPVLGIVNAFGRSDPELAEQLRHVEPIERPRRFAGAPGHLRAAHGPGWALVGDAGYFKDQATAHGITDAFLDAHRLSAAVLSGAGLKAYARTRDAHAREMLTLSAEIGDLLWTMDELKAMHLRLNDLMRIENQELAPAPETALAA